MARQSRAPDSAAPDRPSPGPTVLLTRPAAQSQRFAAALADRFGADFRVVIAPLMAPRFLSPALPTKATALILTSETGAEAARRMKDKLPHLAENLAYCTGDRTAAAAEAAGFRAISAQGDAEALIALILSQRKTAGEELPLLHLRGEDSRGNVAARLLAAGVACTEVVVYRQEEQPLSPEALALLAQPAPLIVPLFSPRSARLFAAAARAAAAPLSLAAISPAAAAMAEALAPARLITAARPDAAAMLDAVTLLIRDLPTA